MADPNFSRSLLPDSWHCNFVAALTGALMSFMGMDRGCTGHSISKDVLSDLPAKPFTSSQATALVSGFAVLARAAFSNAST